MAQAQGEQQKSFSQFTQIQFNLESSQIQTYLEQKNNEGNLRTESNNQTPEPTIFKHQDKYYLIKPNQLGTRTEGGNIRAQDKYHAQNNQNDVTYYHIPRTTLVKEMLKGNFFSSNAQETSQGIWYWLGLVGNGALLSGMVNSTMNPMLQNDPDFGGNIPDPVLPSYISMEAALTGAIITSLFTKYLIQNKKWPSDQVSNDLINDAKKLLADLAVQPMMWAGAFAVGSNWFSGYAAAGLATPIMLLMITGVYETIFDAMPDIQNIKSICNNLGIELEEKDYQKILDNPQEISTMLEDNMPRVFEAYAETSTCSKIGSVLTTVAKKLAQEIQNPETWSYLLVAAGGYFITPAVSNALANNNEESDSGSTQPANPYLVGTIQTLTTMGLFMAPIAVKKLVNAVKGCSNKDKNDEESVLLMDNQ